MAYDVDFEMRNDSALLYYDDNSDDLTSHLIIITII
jgi:hypothetical protein